MTVRDLSFPRKRESRARKLQGAERELDSRLRGNDDDLCDQTPWETKVRAYLRTRP
jgi:hypothetical protein